MAKAAAKTEAKTDKKTKKPEPIVITKSSRRYSIELTTKLLGTVPKKKDLYEDYIATLAPEPELGAEEVETVPELSEDERKELAAKNHTGFHADDKGAFIYSYMVKGFLKSAFEVLQQNQAVPKIKAYKKWTDNLVFVEPRRLYFGKKEPDGDLVRPLRVIIRTGPIVTLVKSDYMKAGNKLSFEIELLSNQVGISWELIEAALEFGQFVGLGQWRGSGAYGRFIVTKRSK